MPLLKYLNGIVASSMLITGDDILGLFEEDQQQLHDTIEILENNNSMLEDSLLETQEQSQLLEEEVITLTDTIRDLDDDMRDLRLDLKASREEYEELQSKCDEYFETIENLNDDVIALEDKIASQQQNIADAQVELKVTASCLEIQRSKKRKFKETLFATQSIAKKMAFHSQAAVEIIQKTFLEKEASELALLAQVHALNERNQVLEKMVSECHSTASKTYEIIEKCNALITQYVSLKDTGSSIFAQDMVTFTRNLGMFAHAGMLARKARTFERNIEGNNNQSSQHPLPLRASNEGGANQDLNETSHSRDPRLRLYPNLQRR